MKSKNGLGDTYGSDAYHSLYLVDGIAHNAQNFGNFLYGSATEALTIPMIVALIGAHYNSIFNSETNGYRPQLDSFDDQFSIICGHLHAIINHYEIHK